ncbi:MAG: LysR family transcriptional regulator [Polyangiaceae bacterium]|nr:LysR family transcriptional regulator [Polyangiaceae bacterium]
MDRLGNIEAFVEVAQLGNFTLAARRLRLSPSALSRRVAQLEHEVGVPLLHRTTRAVRLSEDGRVFFERARAALRELQDAQDATSRLREKPAGLLRVEAPTILGRHVLVPALTRFVARYPDVEVDLSLRDHPLDLASERTDVAVRLGPLDDSGLIARRLGRTKMRVCGAPSYLRRRGTPKTVTALERHERLGYALHGRSMPWRLLDAAKEVDVAPSRRIVVNNAEALIDLAVGGAGLVWVCDFMVAQAQRSGELVEVLASAACVTSPIHAVALPSRSALPKVRVFIDFMAEELAKSGVEVTQPAGRHRGGRAAPP